VPSSASDAAERRRSIRKYTPDAIPEQELREILRLAGRAPSAWNLQPWRFVVVREPALKEQLMAVANKQPQVGRAPAVIVLYSDMDDVLSHLDEVAPSTLSAEDAAAWKARLHKHFDAMTTAARTAWGNAQTFTALGWLLLIAESRGYVTSPMLGFNAEGVKQLLGLPASAVVAALVAIGRGDEEGRLGPRHTLDRVAQFR
jgi:nitroreductase